VAVGAQGQPVGAAGDTPARLPARHGTPREAFLVIPVRVIASGGNAPPRGGEEPYKVGGLASRTLFPSAHDPRRRIGERGPAAGSHCGTGRATTRPTGRPGTARLRPCSASTATARSPGRGSPAPRGCRGRSAPNHDVGLLGVDAHRAQLAGGERERLGAAGRMPAPHGAGTDVALAGESGLFRLSYCFRG